MSKKGTGKKRGGMSASKKSLKKSSENFSHKKQLSNLEKRAKKQIKKMATDDTTSITDFVKTTNKLHAAFALAKLTVKIGEEMERIMK